AERERDGNRSRPEEPADLHFGHDLVRHQIDEADAQRATAAAAQFAVGQEFNALCRQGGTGQLTSAKGYGHGLPPESAMSKERTGCDAAPCPCCTVRLRETFSRPPATPARDRR